MDSKDLNEQSDAIVERITILRSMLLQEDTEIYQIAGISIHAPTRGATVTILMI